MIKDAQGRKWFVRFRYRHGGWKWEARCENTNIGQQCPITKYFDSRALAEADAKATIQGSDAVARMQEFFEQFSKE